MSGFGGEALHNAIVGLNEFFSKPADRQALIRQIFEEMGVAEGTPLPEEMKSLFIQKLSYRILKGESVYDSVTEDNRDIRS